MGSLLWGLVGGFIAWIATEFFARPLTRFFALRAETAEALSRYEDRVDPNPDIFDPAAEWLAQRKAAYEQCGAGLTGFALSNPFIARRLYLFPIPRFRYFARNAGMALLSLAECRPGGGASESCREQIEAALKLSYEPAKPRRWGRF